MSLPQRILLVVCAALLALCARADDYPSKPIRIIVPTTAGSTSDVRTRQFAQQLESRLGVSIIVDNRAGAGGIVGTTAAKQAAADGYTLLYASNGSFTTPPHLVRDAGYDPIKDFAPISQIAQTPVVLVVHPSNKALSLAQLIAQAKTENLSVSFASAGIGSVQHLPAEMLAKRAGVSFTHVPYKGEAQALLDLVSGRVGMMFSTLTGALPHIRAGKLRAIAVTSLKRNSVLPQVPTVAEAGYPGFDSPNWFGFLAPAGTPQRVRDLLHTHFKAISQMPVIRDDLSNAGYQIVASSPAQFAAFILQDYDRIGKLVREIGITLEQ